VFSRLENDFYGITARNLFLANELLSVLSLLEADQLRAVTYKGPVLAASVFGNIGLREFADLDLLVDRRDIGAVQRSLASLGYFLQYPYCEMPQLLSLSSLHEYPFVNENGCKIEVHCEPMPRHLSVPFSTEGFLQRAELTKLLDGRVLTLCPEDLLLFLCAHGVLHGWPTLESICCVAELIGTRDQELDYKLVTAEARRLGICRILGVGLLLAHELFNATLPESVTAQIRNDTKVKGLATEAKDRLFSAPDDLERFVRLPWIHLGSRERALDRIRFCVRSVFTPELADTKMATLPIFLFFLYSALRPFRVFGMYGRAALRVFRRASSA
jgi:hypothetical protein